MKTKSSHDLLLTSLRQFYDSNNDHINVILPIINKNSNISLRLIDWFVTNYCKKYNVVFAKINKVDCVEYFNVYSNYRSQLKAFKKTQFDPFRRRNRIHFSCRFNEKQPIETTIGQLNFFRWFIENNVLTYIENNYEDIENDMNKSQKDLLKKTDCITQEQFKMLLTKEKKRLELSKSLIKNMTKYNGQTTLLFN